MLDFGSGLITMGFFIGGLFFLRYWRRTADPLFGAFAIAFWLLALSQALQVTLSIPLEERSWVFLLRLAAFALIIAAIVFKNRARR
jgi:hypothetical protein